MGHTITHNKILKLESKIAAIRDLPRPKSADEVRRFLGMITYYLRYIPNCSTITAPLRNLTKANVKFNWDMHCEKAFKNIKEDVSARVLVPFDPKYPL